MKLHLDKDPFQTLLTVISEKERIRADILEKDYYVTLMLKELSDNQDQLPAYFKGGTALYKALGSIRRFSEDIDLTVSVEGCSNSQAKRRLEHAANKYSYLSRTTNKSMEANLKGSITSVYDYDSVINVGEDMLQRFQHVKVEATSFTVSEPYEPMLIEPVLYTKADKEQQKILAEQYDVKPFLINTIKLERIFVDKIFAAEFYFQRGNEKYFDVSKHLYDITVLMNHEKIQNMFSNNNVFFEMISYKRTEEESRIGSNLSDMPFEDFSILYNVRENEKLKDVFNNMQDIYVFDDSDKLEYDDMVNTLEQLRCILFALEPEQTESFDLNM